MCCVVCSVTLPVLVPHTGCFQLLKNIYLFIYFWPRWVFAAAWNFPQVAVSGGCSLVTVLRLLTCGSFSCVAFSSCSVWLHSCGTWASVSRGMWDLPRPEIEPVSPKLQDRFLPTELPGEASLHSLE